MIKKADALQLTAGLVVILMLKTLKPDLNLVKY